MHLAKWEACSAARESDRGKIAARKPHVAEESGEENDVSCTCELCIARDYYKKSARQKYGNARGCFAKGFVLSCSRECTFGA